MAGDQQLHQRHQLQLQGVRGFEMLGYGELIETRARVGQHARGRENATNGANPERLMKSRRRSGEQADSSVASAVNSASRDTSPLDSFMPTMLG